MGHLLLLGQHRPTSLVFSMVPPKDPPVVGAAFPQ